MYGDAGEVERAVGLFEECDEAGLHMDVFCFNALMGAVIRKDHADKVLEVRRREEAPFLCCCCYRTTTAVNDDDDDNLFKCLRSTTEQLKSFAPRPSVTSPSLLPNLGDDYIVYVIYILHTVIRCHAFRSR